MTGPDSHERGDGEGAGPFRGKLLGMKGEIRMAKEKLRQRSNGSIGGSHE